MPNYDLVLLDADGTLFDYDQAEADALAKLFAAHQFAYTPEVLAAYRRINAALWLDFEHGRISKSELQSARFQRLLQVCGLTGEGETCNAEYIDYLAEGAYLLPGAEQVCRALSEQCTLVLATNGIARCQRQRVALSSIGQFISHIAVSEEAGYQKPQAGFFDYAFGLCGHSDRSRAIMVGDSLSADIAGGAAFGIATCWYNPREEQLPLAYRADFQIARLEELLPIVLG